MRIFSSNRYGVSGQVLLKFSLQCMRSVASFFFIKQVSVMTSAPIIVAAHQHFNTQNSVCVTHHSQQLNRERSSTDGQKSDKPKLQEANVSTSINFIKWRTCAPPFPSRVSHLKQKQLFIN